MTDKLLTYLKHQQQLLIELIRLAERQQTALVKYDMKELEFVSNNQFHVANDLREAEEQRIKLLMTWLGITRKQASTLWLSAIEKHIGKEEAIEFKRLRSELKKQVLYLHSLNTTNRVLANRAQTGLNEIISIFTSGTSHVCNVRI